MDGGCYDGAEGVGDTVNEGGEEETLTPRRVYGEVGVGGRGRT